MKTIKLGPKDIGLELTRWQASHLRDVLRTALVEGGLSESRATALREIAKQLDDEIERTND